MKILITFFAISILYFSLLTFQSDGIGFIIAKSDVERISRESAAGAIQLFDAEAYADGYMVINEVAAAQFVDGYIKEKATRDKRWSEEQIKTSVNTENSSTPEKNPQSAVVRVNVQYEGEDFFRLPFLERNDITAQTSYEVMGR